MGDCRRSTILTAAILVLTGTTWSATWSPINTGLPGAGLGVNSLAIDPKSPSTIYAQAASNPLSGPVVVPQLFKTTDGGGSWKSVSSLTRVTALAIDPINSSTLYAGTDQGVVKSTNGGASWIVAGNGLPDGSVSRLVIDPINSSTLYTVIVGNGPIAISTFGPVNSAVTVFKSTDGGGSWKALDIGLAPGGFISLLVIDPVTSSTLYLSSPPFGPPSSTGEPPPGGVLKSTDGGVTWNALTGLPPNALVNSLAIDPSSSSTLYAAVPSFPPPAGVGTPFSGILKSTDGGVSWRALSGLPSGVAVSNLVIDPVTTSTIYAAGSSFTPGGPPGSTIRKSTDGGEHWNAIDAGLPANTSINSLAVDPVNPSRIYAGFVGFVGFFVNGVGVNGVGGATGGVFSSADGGQSWNAAGALSSFDVRTVAVSPVAPGSIYAGGLGGAFKSVDGGANWSGAGLSSYTGSLLADSVHPDILYAQTGTSNGCDSSQNLLFKSTDGGANWSDSVSPRNSGCILNVTFGSVHAAPMLIDPTNSSTLYVGESDGLDGYSAVLKSTDAGASWSTTWDFFRGLRGSVRALAIDPARSATLFAGIDDAGSGGSPFQTGPVQSTPESRGLFKSADGGLTWTNTGLTKNAVSLVVIDPSNSRVMYAAAAGPASGPPGFLGLFKSADGGATWLAINQGLTSVIGTRLTTATALVLDPASSNILYLGTSNAGVFRSIDGGASWSAFNDGLDNLQIRDLAVASKPRTVYAGTAGGVFKVIDE